VKHNLSVVSLELEQARAALQMANQTLNITVAHEFGMEVTLIATCSAVGVERVARLFWTHYKDKSPFPLDRYLFYFFLSCYLMSDSNYELIPLSVPINVGHLLFL